MQTTLVCSHWAAVLPQQPNQPLPLDEAMLVADSHQHLLPNVYLLI
jgi:hypothetical protein